MKIVAVGDISFKEGEGEENEKEDGIKTFENIKENIKNQEPSLVLALGDLTYKGKVDDFVNESQEIENIIRPIVGNHDDREKLSGDKAKDFWSQLRDKYLVPHNINISDNEKKNKYYSFTIERICFIVLYSHPEFIDKKEQKDFAFQKLLEASSNPQIDWIIVCYHKPSVTSDADGGHPAETGIAEIYHEIFDHFGVDMILNGHNHNYLRTKLVRNNPKTSDGEDNGDDEEEDTETVTVVSEVDNNVYDTRKGRVFIGVGSGGRHRDPFNDPQEKYIKFRHDESYGILSIEVEDKKMSCKFIRNKKQGNDPIENRIIDSFTLDKSSIMDSNECGDHKHWDQATQSCVHDNSSSFKRGEEDLDRDDIGTIVCTRNNT